MSLELPVIVLPAEGVWRVHPNPLTLPERPGPGEVPPNRFDDPLGQYRVRYLATTRKGAFLEVLARFRRSPETVERLQSVRNIVEDSEPLLQPGRVPERYLAALRAARVTGGGQQCFVDVASPAAQALLDRHPRIRRVLETSGLGTADAPAQLDEATIRLGGPHGRPITQAVSRAVFEGTTASGIRYTSRLDVAEECWAVFEETPLDFRDVRAVIPGDADLAAAVEALSLPLPSTGEQGERRADG